MRRLVVALFVVALVFTLVGCGGGDKAAAPAEAPAADAAAPAAAPAEPAQPALSDNEPPIFEPFPSGSAVPTEVADLIAAKQPTLIYFYDPTQNSSKETRKMVDSVLEANRGLVELAAYDIGKYVSSDAAKPVTLDKDFAKDPKYQASINLARLLNVSYTPYMVLTDSQGYIIWKFKGLADKDFLEREILRASN
jgi:predicted small lipoprotein YifL